MLSLLAALTVSHEEVCRQLADDFRRRRIEKNLTRRQVASRAGVPLASVARFEQKALVSLSSLARLAVTLGYTSELMEVFKHPKYNTMDELQTIRRQRNKTKASGK